MKPTCPTACPLKQRMNQHKEAEEGNEEFRELLNEMTPFQRRQTLAFATFAYYKYKGFAKFSTWIEMLERQRVLYFIWGFFVRIDFAMIRGR
jgi:hypothetical protein